MRRYDIVLIGWVAVVGGTACDEEAPPVEKVLGLEVCPAGIEGICVPAPAADGRSRVTVQVCAPPAGAQRIAGRRQDLAVSLTATSGQWMGAPDPTKPGTTTVRLGRSDCALADLTPTLVPGPVRITAELSGYSVARNLVLGAAPIEDLEVTATPLVLPAGASAQIQVKALVRARGAAAPSTGTAVTFRLEATPVTATRIVSPSRVFVDATGTAESQVTLGPGVTSLSIVATATPPGVEGAATPPARVGTLTLTPLGP